MPGQFRFPKECRLRKKKEFEYVFSRGKRIPGEGFVCYWLPEEALGDKLGIVVSKKVGRAVKRNRIKRYVREFYRLHRPYFTRHGAIIVVARPVVSTWDHSAIDAELERLFRTGGILDG